MMNHADISGWTIRQYASADKFLWDDFLVDARNATFLFYRDYMDYHADRFKDASLLCFREGRLEALLPAHFSEGILHSHGGLTYGGFIVSREFTLLHALELWPAVCRFVVETMGARLLRYAPLPVIYAQYPAQEDLYVLFRLGARLVNRRAAAVIPLTDALPFGVKRRQKVRKADRQGLIARCSDCWDEFWTLLNNNLYDRYEARPVHTLSEIELLHQRFPNQICFYEARFPDGEMAAGCVIYKTDRVAHAQYISSTPRGRSAGAVDFLLDYLIHEECSSMAYFDLGTSADDTPSGLNESLMYQKEDMGARTVIYDTYELDLDKLTL